MALLRIEDLRVRVGLLETDVTKDVEITDCYTMAMNLIEDYLDRRILKSTYKDTFRHTHTGLVKAWPIESITTIDGVAPSITLKADFERGIIYDICWDHVIVEYIGGWLDPDIPPAITHAMNVIFDKLWYSVPGWGIATAAEPTSSEVKRFSINGMTVEYFQNENAGSSSSSSWIPETLKPLLAGYRRESVIGAG